MSTGTILPPVTRPRLRFSSRHCTTPAPTMADARYRDAGRAYKASGTACAWRRLRKCDGRKPVIRLKVLEKAKGFR